MPVQEGGNLGQEGGVEFVPAVHDGLLERRVEEQLVVPFHVTHLPAFGLLEVRVVAVPEGDVEVPHVVHLQRLSLFFGQVGALSDVSVRILGDFLDDVIVDEGRNVDVGAIAVVVLALDPFEGVLEAVEPLLDIFLLRRRRLFRLMEHYGRAPDGIEAHGLIHGLFDLEVIAALEVRFFRHFDVDPVPRDLLVVGEGIYALILTVEVHFDAEHHGGPAHAANAGDFHGHDVPQEGLVAVVREQDPVLVAPAAEDGGLLVQFDPVGFLGHAPGGVSAALDAAGRLHDLFVGIEAGRVFEPESRLDIRLLAVDGLSAFGSDMDRGNLEVRGDDLVVQRIDVRGLGRLGRILGIDGLFGFPAIVELHRLAVGGPDPEIFQVSVGIDGNTFLQRAVRPFNPGVLSVQGPGRAFPDDRFRGVGEGVGPVLDDPFRRRDDDAAAILEEYFREGGQGAGFHIGFSVPVSGDDFPERGRSRRLVFRDNPILLAGNRKEEDFRQEQEAMSQVALHGTKIVDRT